MFTFLTIFRVKIKSALKIMKVFILVPGETKLDHQTKQSIHSTVCEAGALSRTYTSTEVS